MSIVFIFIIIITIIIIIIIVTIIDWLQALLTRSFTEQLIVGNFPYTTQWNDIDYMHEKLDFTVDRQRYLNLSNIIHSLHGKV